MIRYLILLVLSACAAGCGMAAGEKTDADKPLTVVEVRTIQKEKPEEFKTKFAGKKIIVVGKVRSLPATYPGAFDTLGYQDIMLEGNSEHRGINCQVTEAEFAKFKDLQEGDVVTVTGTVKPNEFTMDLTGCTKLTAPAK